MYGVINAKLVYRYCIRSVFEWLLKLYVHFVQLVRRAAEKLIIRRKRKMFSFFKQKKPSPSSSPESDPIPSGNDFVIVDQKQTGADSNPTPLYPNFGVQFGNPGLPPALPSGYPPGYPPAHPHRPPFQHSDSIQNNYITGVPFKLSPELSTGDSDEITKIQVDDILALITSRMEVTQTNYDFTLERSLLQQNETESSESPESPEAAE